MTNKNLGATKTRARLLGASALLAAALGAMVLAACQSSAVPTGAYDAPGTADCLSNVTLTDQDGKPVNLASLKGKPALVEFIYTSCPGPCLMMTAQMARVADKLGGALGSKINFVSITIDPEHDGSQVMRQYAKDQGAQRPGWLFLTGTPKDVEQAMAGFGVKRKRESDGSIDHVVDFFLVGADGRRRRIYNPSEAKPEAVAADLEKAAAPG